LLRVTETIQVDSAEAPDIRGLFDWRDDTSL
jgi:hypothetical protein